jgi:hypothetical protein
VESGGEMYINTGGSTLVFRVTPGGADAGWTATGTKRVLGYMDLITA